MKRGASGISSERYLNCRNVFSKKYMYKRKVKVVAVSIYRLARVDGATVVRVRVK